MLRKFCCALLALLLVAAPTALGDPLTKPIPEIFSLAYERLQTAIRRERTVTWWATVEPVAVDGYVDGALDMLTMMLSSMEISGAMLAFKENAGGYVEAAIRAAGRDIGTFGHMARDGRTAINLTGQWVSVAQGDEAEAVTMLGLDDFGASLLTLNYESLRSGETPVISWLERQGKRLWSLGSPYCWDNHNLSVPSGYTSHGVSYELNTQAMRTVLAQWADGLASEGLSFDFAGIDLAAGVGDDAFDAFIGRLRAFAATAELSSPIKFSLAFGEGDLLRTAKGSGTLRENGKTTGFSYNYACDLSATRMTRKYNIDFQPKTMDTLVLKSSQTTTSNNKDNGSDELTLTASGDFDGKPYRLEIHSSMANRYSLGSRDRLEENISGSLTATLTYDGRTVLDISVGREGQAYSYQWLTMPINITERFDVRIATDQGTLFQGVITLGLDVAVGTAEAPDILAEAPRVEDLDFIALQKLRESMRAGLADAKQLLLQAMPLSAMRSLFQTN